MTGFWPDGVRCVIGPVRAISGVLCGVYDYRAWGGWSVSKDCVFCCDLVDPGPQTGRILVQC